MASSNCYWIYKLTSPSGLYYVGLTNNIQKRFNHYYHKTCKGQRLLYTELLKYDLDKFKIEILHTHLTKGQAIEIEKIEIGKIKHNSLNLSDGYDMPNTDLSNRMQPIVQYSLSGEYIKTWTSCTDAAISVYGGKKSAILNIAQVARYNIKNYYMGYLWYRVSDCNKADRVKPYSDARGRRILQLTLTGEIVAVYDNQNVAAKILGFSQWNINSCIRGRSKKYNGFLWKYEDVYNNPSRVIQKHQPVIQYDKNKNIIAEYATISEACNATGLTRTTITRGAKGLIKNPAEFIWEYKNN